MSKGADLVLDIYITKSKVPEVGRENNGFYKDYIITIKEFQQGKKNTVEMGRKPFQTCQEDSIRRWFSGFGTELMDSRILNLDIIKKLK